MNLRQTLLLSFAAILLLSPTAVARDWLATDFGAKADGITLNTSALQAAIDHISARGGGRLILSGGDFLCGSIYLKSGVDLHISAGARLLGSPNPWDYVRDPVARWTALLLAVDQHDIALTGSGTVDCQGFEVGTKIVEYVHKGIVEDKLGLDRVSAEIRPENIHFFRCNGVTVQDVSINNPASWNQQYDQCRNLLIERVKVDSKCYWNNDGLDVVDCSDVVIRDCDFDASDDVFCFKSHVPNGVSDNVLVENCRGRSSANGIKFGTVTRGTFRNFTFRNIEIYDTYRSAITIASVDGATIENITVDGLRSINTGNPIFLRTGNRREGEAPCMRNIIIRNMYAEVPFGKPDAGYMYEGPVEDLPRNICPSGIQGIPDIRIENVLLENVEIHYPGKADPEYAFCGSSKAELEAIPELEKSYPEYSNWKELPAWGFYIRHADNVTFKNVKLVVEDEDYRPAVVADDVNGLDLKGLTVVQKSAPKGKKQTVFNKVRIYKLK